MEISCLVVLSEGYLLAGEYENAGQTAEECLELAVRFGARTYIGWTHRLLGEVSLTTEVEKAFSYFEKSIVISKEIKAENDLALSYSGLGRYHKQQGNIKQARHYLTEALEIFERLGTLLEPEKVGKELADLM